MARFIMVARSHDGKQAMPVNTIILNENNEQKVFDAGAEAAAQRKHKKSLKTRPPTAEESKILHDIFLERTTTQCVPMCTTRLRTIRVCHPQERNLHDLVFGGILMREAFELAYATATLYCRGRPIFRAIDELAFVHPVPIGSILELMAVIAYTEPSVDGLLMHIQVTADVINVETGQRVTTNTFHLTFKTSGSDILLPVLPETYEEGIMYIEGRRRLKVAADIARPSPFDLINV